MSWYSFTTQLNPNPKPKHEEIYSERPIVLKKAALCQLHAYYVDVKRTVTAIFEGCNYKAITDKKVQNQSIFVWGALSNFTSEARPFNLGTCNDMK